MEGVFNQTPRPEKCTHKRSSKSLREVQRNYLGGLRVSEQIWPKETTCLEGKCARE